MDTPLEIETPGGPVWLFGRDTGRPLLLIITGAFANIGTLEGAQEAFPFLDVLRAFLPGNHSPSLGDTSVKSFGAAFSYAISGRFSGRLVMVLGMSVGALVALELKAPSVRRLVLVEPVLMTRGAWPLLDFQQRMPPGGETFVRNIFGVAADSVEPRDYTHLLDDLRIPTVVMLGDEALEPSRDLGGRWPSLVGEEMRERLRRHSLIEVVDIQGAGHNVATEARAQFLSALRRSLAPSSFARSK
jgi:pimeloyl-ACP methyl ester carboxylesterase